MWKEVLERFENHAPVSVMTQVALEHALPACWVDEVFQASRQRQYPRELLFSSVVELMMLVSLGLRPSLHAAAKKMAHLPVTLAALYDKVKRTEPQVLRALAQGSATRLDPVIAAVSTQPSLQGWQLRILDGNHLPASEKRLAPLHAHRGAAMPSHTLVVYDPNTALVTDILACKDAHESERVGAATSLEQAQQGQVWIADRHFCTRTLLQGWEQRQAGFIVREHARHPKLDKTGPWSEGVPTESGEVREQAIELPITKEAVAAAPSWRRIEIQLQEPIESGDHSIALWSNLPPSIDAATIAQLYRKRWRIEGLFGRLESELHSEIRTLGHPRAALLGIAAAVLAFNVLALLKRCVEQARGKLAPALDVSTYHQGVHVASDYQGMLIALGLKCGYRGARRQPGMLRSTCCSWLATSVRAALPRPSAVPRRKSPGDTWLALRYASNCPPLVFSNRLQGQDLERDGSWVQEQQRRFVASAWHQLRPLDRVCRLLRLHGLHLFTPNDR